MDRREETKMMILLQKQRKRMEIFARIDKILSAGIRHFEAETPREWLKERGITPEATGAGFCSGQLNKKKSEEFVRDLESVQFIRANNIIGKNGKTGYLMFADYGITFPLKDVKGNVVSFYGIPLQGKRQDHSFLNDDGIYPCFPHEMTTRLFVTVSILDAATLLEAKLLENRDAVICVPNGRLLSQHEEAIQRLPYLQTIFWIESPAVKLVKPLEGRVMPEGYITKSKKNKP
jgi:hypothetical protein